LRRRLPLAVSLALLGLLVFLALATGGKRTLFRSGGEERIGLGVGDTAPDFVLPQLGGGEVRLWDLRGKPVFINFWASWCGPCRQEMPEIEKLYRAEGESVHFLAVNVEEPPQVAEGFVREIGFSVPVLLDVEGRVFYEEWGMRAFPTSVFLDARGRVCARIEGAISGSLMRAAVEEAKRGCG